jgi:uncharacterized ubiquitin-like protein YukD
MSDRMPGRIPDKKDTFIYLFLDLFKLSIKRQAGCQIKCQNERRAKGRNKRQI